MGLNSDIIGFGFFSKEIVKHLEYAEVVYEGVPEGSVIVAHIIACETTPQSTELANALGFEPWDFTKHRFEAQLVLEHAEQLKLLPYHFPDHKDAICDLIALAEAGFSFLFLVNG